MDSFRLALRNLARQKFRTGITLAAIAFGVAGLILSGGFVRDVFHQLGEAFIRSQSGHIQVAKAGYLGSAFVAPERHLIEEPEITARAISMMAGVSDVMARVHFTGLLNNGRTDWPVVGEGVEPGKESKLATHVRTVAGRALTDGDRYGITVGEGAAQALKLVPGDHVTVIVNAAEGVLNTLELEVVGVFQTFSKEFDARAIRMHLSAARELLGTRGANVLVVSLAKTEQTAAIATRINDDIGGGGLEVKRWDELNDFYGKTVTLYERQFGILQLIVLAMVLISVANSVNMSAFERVGEVGTMMALGNRRADVLRLMLMEGSLLGVIGALVGVLTGAVVAMGISTVGIAMPAPPNSNLGYTAAIRVVPSVLAGAFLVGVAASTVASIPPAFRMSRMSIVDALRANG